MSILPGATIGILGGGQLGRMTAMAARSLGYHVRALDPDPSCASRFVVDKCVTASFEDAAAAAELANGCDVVTLEIEKVSVKSLEAAGKFAPVRPGPRVLEVIQDRARQKKWLVDHGFPLGTYEEANSAEQLAAAVSRQGSSFAKATTGGYDGGGQARLSRPDEAAAAFAALGHGPLVVEKALELEAELSVLVARAPSGEVAVYPPALNHHVNRILEWSVLPGPLPAEIREKATAIASKIASALQVEGLLVVELFLVKDGRLLVNELAPRPHNSFHATEVGAVTSQFEQLVRAVCDLPLGSTEVIRPAAIVNLLGDLWVNDQTPPFDRALALPGVGVHLYGKRVARPGRKMGHLTAVGATPEEAVARVLEAKAALLGR